MIVVIELLNLLHEGGDKNETNDVHILPDSFVDWEQNILRLHALTEQVFFRIKFYSLGKHGRLLMFTFNYFIKKKLD